MMIECPACASAYHIASDCLRVSGRRVRCMACKTVWHCVMPLRHHLDEDDILSHRVFAMDSPDNAAQNLPDAINVEASSERSVAPRFDELYATTMRAQEGRAVRRLRWPLPGLTIPVLVLGVGMAAVAWRDALARIAPGSATLLAAIGLPVNQNDLNLKNIASSLVEEGAQRVLAVTGEIDNKSDHTAPVPPLTITVRTAQGRVLYTWLAHASTANLAQGEHVAFRARLAAPPNGAASVAVDFANLRKPLREAKR